MTCCPDCKQEQKGVGVDLKSRITIQQVEFNGQVIIHLPAQPLPLLLQHNFTLHGATYYLESISCWINQDHFTCVQYIHAATSGFRTGWYAYDGLKDYNANRELRKLSPNVTFLSETSPEHRWLNLHQVFDLRYSRTVTPAFADFVIHPGPVIDQQKLPLQPPKKSNPSEIL